MPSTPFAGGSLFVESLEARIAPTGLVAISNDPLDPNATGDPRYLTYTTAPSAGKLGFVTAASVGVNSPGLFALKMSGSAASGVAGDELVVFNPTQGFNFSSPFLQATNGTLIAFFRDLNGDNQVQANELVGISMNKKASVNVNGNVYGDIVTNLSKDGNTVSVTSPGNFKTSITGITVVGNIYHDATATTGGQILAGGNIDAVRVNGNVGAVLAGSATNGATFNFTGLANTNSGTLATPGFNAAVPGASITNVSLTSLTNAIHAGDGGLGAVGGTVSGVTILSDVDGFSILAGSGGVGSDTVKGGTGGDVSTVLVNGVPDTGAHGLINIQAGTGGANPAFKGGAGGNITAVGTSLSALPGSTGTITTSADFLNDNILLHAGDGGAGRKGGGGGDVSSSQLFGAIPYLGNANNAEIQVIAGAGGVGSIGKGGAGGNVSQITAENLDQGADTVGASSAILIAGGAGGGVKAGGSVDAITLLGGRLLVGGGAGGSGNHGGDGGTVNTVNILNTTSIVAHSVAITAGAAGDGSVSFGGIGGDVNTVNMADADITAFAVTAGRGGTSAVGTGGAGGSVTNLKLNESGPARTTPGTVTITSGTGGDGAGGGGVAGNVTTVQFFGSDFKYTVTAGAGGNTTAGGTGDGGAGGSLINVGISNQPAAADTPNFAPGATGVVTAGVGGKGTVNGGAGGDLTQVSLRVAFDSVLTAGNGGAGGSGAAGVGGSVTGSAVDSLLGGITVKAGDGGVVGAAPGDGGSIGTPSGAGFVAAAAGDIILTAGNGGAGGAGGDVDNSGTSLNELTGLPNFGNLTITAGNGSSANGIAGAGGSVNTFSGYIGYGTTDGTAGGTVLHSTTIKAGAGGGDNGEKLTGAGGSVSGIKLTGDTLDSVDPTIITELITVDAGDAGGTGIAKKGGAGGGVSNVVIYNLDQGAVVQHLAAGNGANALKKPGAGGSISDVHVGTAQDGRPDDIGLRDGAAYGYFRDANGTLLAGGLFAGTGGVASRTGAVAAAGNVTVITADAIASIVAGKGTSPQLAGTVDDIKLNGLVASAADGTGAFTNFDTANIVGSVQNPNAAGASTFHGGDGLIAAANITLNRNFTPEAELTLDANGNRILVDPRQPGGVVTTAA